MCLNIEIIKYYKKKLLNIFKSKEDIEFETTINFLNNNVEFPLMYTDIEEHNDYKLKVKFSDIYGDDLNI